MSAKNLKDEAHKRWLEALLDRLRTRPAIETYPLDPVERALLMDKIEQQRAALRLGRQCVVESFDYAETPDDTLLAEARLRDIDDALGDKDD